jgi:glyoxylase-like metal-dependent hydrolase (beta-lactamase superfamily II)
MMGISLNSENRELIAVRYGTSMFPAEAVFYGHQGKDKIPFHWLFYVIRSGSRIILADTGFEDPGLAQYFSVKIQPVSRCLNEAGIRPEEITDIILTHTHFDHVGTIQQFPQARVIIQKEEYESFLKNGRDKKAMAYLKDKKNLILFDQEYLIDSWIRVVKIGGHTIGSSIIELDTKQGKILLSGDEVYVPDNWQKKIPLGTYFHHQINKKFIESLPGEYSKIYLFHDPALVTGSENFRVVESGL